MGFAEFLSKTRGFTQLDHPVSHINVSVENRCK